jgi:hypothetical protein
MGFSQRRLIFLRVGRIENALANQRVPGRSACWVVPASLAGDRPENSSDADRGIDAGLLYIAVAGYCITVCGLPDGSNGDADCPIGLRRYPSRRFRTLARGSGWDHA